MNKFFEEVKVAYKGTQPTHEVSLEWVKSMIKAMAEAGFTEFSWDGTVLHGDRSYNLSAANRGFIVQSLKEMGFYVETKPKYGLTSVIYATISGWA